MKTDRELLEAAAKAAGIWVGDEDFADPIDRKYVPNLGLWVHVGDLDDIGHWWNPLHNGDHALRLAVSLVIEVRYWPEGEVEARWHEGPDVVKNVVEEPGSLRNGPDPVAATCRAIVRAAAAMTG
jgi:hypothetical protein